MEALVCWAAALTKRRPLGPVVDAPLPGALIKVAPSDSFVLAPGMVEWFVCKAFDEWVAGSISNLQIWARLVDAVVEFVV